MTREKSLLGNAAKEEETDLREAEATRIIFSKGFQALLVDKGGSARRFCVRVLTRL